MGNVKSNFLTLHTQIFVDKFYKSELSDELISSYPILLKLMENDLIELKNNLVNTDGVWPLIPPNIKDLSDNDVNDVVDKINDFIDKNNIREDKFEGTCEELRVILKECNENMCVFLLEMSVKIFYTNMILETSLKVCNDLVLTRTELTKCLEDLNYRDVLDNICAKYKLEDYPATTAKWIARNYPFFLMMKPSFVNNK